MGFVVNSRGGVALQFPAFLSNFQQVTIPKGEPTELVVVDASSYDSRVAHGNYILFPGKAAML
jgi:hypothetical protein